MKILFTSVGRRVELIQEFIKAAEKLSFELIIFGADIDETAPALYFCDKKIICPRICDGNYIPFLLNKCKEENIDAVIPTIDTDLLILAEAREKFEQIGTKVFISDLDKVSICRDKRLTHDYFISLGLNSPNTYCDYKDYKESYPAFIKPKDGSSSIYAYKVKNVKELEMFASVVPEYIVQKLINGTEYTIDAFCDYDGKPLLITPRIRLAVRSGEVLKTQISQDKQIIEEVKRILNDFKPRGAITIQLIRNGNIDYFIEINPRFGGGSPLSMKAGANSAELLLKIIDNETINYIENAAADKLIYSRFDQSIRIK